MNRFYPIREATEYRIQYEDSQAEAFETSSAWWQNVAQKETDTNDFGKFSSIPPNDSIQPVPYLAERKPCVDTVRLLCTQKINTDDDKFYSELKSNCLQLNGPSTKISHAENCTSPFEDFRIDTHWDHQRDSPLENIFLASSKTASSKGRFPERLYKLLQDAEDYGFSDIVSWQPHGRSFVVHSTKLFTSLILSKYFKQTQFASFCRQLSNYGFARMKGGGRGRGVYYHKDSCFVRGRPNLCAKIKRLSQVGCTSQEPNFYDMEPISTGAIKSRLQQSLPVTDTKRWFSTKEPCFSNVDGYNENVSKEFILAQKASCPASSIATDCSELAPSGQLMPLGKHCLGGFGKSCMVLHQPANRRNCSVDSNVVSHQVHGGSDIEAPNKHSTSFQDNLLGTSFSPEEQKVLARSLPTAAELLEDNDFFSLEGEGLLY